MSCKVIHMNSAPVNWQKRPDEYVYIGRPGPFGNPFPLKEPANTSSRTQSIEKFRKYFVERLHDDKEFYDMVKSLDGKTLVCYCAPRACHGDIIVEYVEKINDGTIQSGGIYIFSPTEGEET